MDFLLHTSLFSGTIGLTALAVLAALIVWWWDWRPSLVILVGLHYGVATIMVQAYGVAAAWMWAHLIVSGIGTAMLATSAHRIRLHRRIARPGIGLLRLLGLILAAIILQVQMIRLPLPQISEAHLDFFTWLVVTGMLALALSDHPLHVAVGVSLWLTPAYGVSALLLPNAALLLLMGVMELLAYLTLSYLTLSASGESLLRPYVLRDQFPQTAGNPRPESVPGGAGD